MKLGLPQRRKGAESFKLNSLKNIIRIHFSQLPIVNCQLLLCILLFSSCQKKQEWQWSELKQLSQYEISDLKRINDSTIIGVGGERYFHGEYYYSNNNGVTWNQKEIIDKQLYGISFLNRDTLFACGLDGKLLQSTNAGIDWNIIQNFRWMPMRNLIFVNDSIIISCGGSGFSRGIFVRSSDGGANWKTDTLASEMRDLCNTDAQTVYCCGYGKILKSQDAGATWQQQNAETRQPGPRACRAVCIRTALA